MSTNAEAETVVQLASGLTIQTCSDDFESGDYLRVRRPDGVEMHRWESAAWRDRPQACMGEIFTTIAGIVRAPTDRDEIVLSLADGWSMRTASGADCGDYLRLCRADESEYLYYDHREWQDDPVIVVGAFLNAAGGLRFADRVDASQTEAPRRR